MVDHAGGMGNLLEDRMWDVQQDAQKDSKDEVQKPLGGGMRYLVEGLQGLAAYLRCGIYGVWKGR